MTEGTAAPQPPSPGQGEEAARNEKWHRELGGEGPPPDLICVVESYWQAHETARDLGYPSLTEALEALDDFRSAPPSSGEAEAVARERGR